MVDDSLIHRALAMGAAALAIFGGVGGLVAVPYQPPLYSTVATVNPEEQRGQQVAPAMSQLEMKETPAGAPPTGKYCVEMRGQNFFKSVHVEVPVHQANPFSWGHFSQGATVEEPGMTILYQHAPGAPHLQMSATAKDLQWLVDQWTNGSVDVKATPVTEFKITPANEYKGVAHMLTLNPVQQKESGIDYAKILDVIAAVLSIAEVVAGQAEKRRKDAHEPARNSYRVEDGALVRTAESGAKETVLSQEDLEKSKENDRQLIATWAAYIQTLFNTWNATYPKLSGSPDAAVNAEVEKQLDEVQHSMCATFTQLKQFIEGTGRQLAGFDAIQAVCRG